MSDKQNNSTSNEKHKLRIHIDLGDNSLYDLGYLSIDIYHLIVFSKLIEDCDQEALEKYFYRPKRGFGLTRDRSILKKYRNSANIEHLEDGSVVIDISQVGAIAALIIPFIAIYVDKKIKENGEKVTFEISSDDEELKELIEKVGEGYYGWGDNGFKWLLDTLEKRGYSVEVINKDIYRINRVMTNYEKRIIRTIKKYI